MSEIYEMAEYFRRINDTLQQHQESMENNPPKEVQLLRAMKAFMPEERHANIDRAISVMMLSRTFESMQAHGSASIHADGVYDIDSSCIAGKGSMNGLMLAAMAMMAGNGR